MISGGIGWDVIVGGVIFIVWLIRLESKVLYMEKDNDRYREESSTREEKLWMKIDMLVTKMETVVTSLAKLEGFLSSHNDKKND